MRRRQWRSRQGRSRSEAFHHAWWCSASWSRPQSGPGRAQQNPEPQPAAMRCPTWPVKSSGRQPRCATRRPAPQPWFEPEGAGQRRARQPHVEPERRCRHHSSRTRRTSHRRHARPACSSSSLQAGVRPGPLPGPEREARRQARRSGQRLPVRRAQLSAQAARQPRARSARRSHRSLEPARGWRKAR